MQGYWTNDTVTLLERPPEFGEKAIISPRGRRIRQKRLDQFLAQPKDDIHYDDAIWQGENYGSRSTLRTSLVTDEQRPPSA